MSLIEGYFGGRYRLLEELEKGHFLVSYLARDEISGMEMVVDVVDPEKSASPHLAARLKEILDTAAELVSPCIASLFAWGEEKGQIYMVRERVKGVELSEVLAEVGELPVGQVTEIARAATQGLAQAYGRGLFYLGLNPGQFILDRRGEVKMVRVGYGWLLEEMEPLLAARVSPYRAPETDGGKEGTRTSDVYSLAVMIREMLPVNDGSERLRSLLDKSTSPIPKHRPSSPRLLLEGLVEVAEGPHSQYPAGETPEYAAYGGKRDGGESIISKEDTTPSHYISLKKGPRGRPFRILFLIFLGGVIIWLLYAAVSGSLLSREDETKSSSELEEEEIKIVLPDVQGLSVLEAEEILRDLGLEIVSREAPSRLWSVGVVAAQEPQEGTILKRGDTVCLVISSGRDEAQEMAPGGEAEHLSPSQPEVTPGETSPPGGSEAIQPPPAGVSPGFSLPRPKALAPRAIATLSTHSGSSPLYVAMDASRSYDPDGTITRYVWDCGDGTILEGASMQHVFDPAVTPSRFQVVLRVYDRDGLSGSCLATVEVY